VSKLSVCLNQYREIIVFGFVGITSSAVYLLVVAILSLHFRLGNTSSIIIAYIIGTIVSYVGSGLFAFRQPMTGANLIKFLTVVCISFVLNVIISEVLTIFAVQAVTIGIVNIGVVGVFNFLLHKYWTFK